MTPILPKYRRVGAVGMFDGVHRGHQQVVHQVCELAATKALVPTIFTFDCHPLSVIAPERAPKLLTSMCRRAQLLITAGAQDVQYLDFKDIRHLSAEDFLKRLHSRYSVDCLVVGFNHHFGKGGKGTFEQYKEYGDNIGLEIVLGTEYISPKTDMPVSSSAIRRLISSGDITTANAMSGHPYRITGIVIHGNNIGSGIGYPTANLQPLLSDYQLPACGVYAARATLAGGLILPAMVNIGDNPTIADRNSGVRIEAHIIGYEGDLYGSVLSLDFIARLRDEQKFSSLDALAAQLSIDLSYTLDAIANANV